MKNNNRQVTGCNVKAAAKAIEATLVAEDKAVAARRAIDVAEDARRQHVLRELAKGDVLEMGLSEPHHRPTKRVKKM